LFKQLLSDYFTGLTSDNIAKPVLLPMQQRWARIRRGADRSSATFFGFGSGFEFSGKTGPGFGMYGMVIMVYGI